MATQDHTISAGRRASMHTKNWLQITAGAALLVTGSRFRGLLSAALAGAGGVLLYDGMMHGDDERVAAFARGVRLHSTIWVDASPGQCYRTWRDLRRMPHFVDSLEEVTPISERRSRWRTKAMGGYPLEWEAEIIKDEPDATIGWRSMPGSDVKTSGSVRFVPEDDGTLVSLTMKYQLPAGPIGDAVLRMLAHSPDRQARRMLRRFKDAVEAERDQEERDEMSRVDEASMDSFPASDPPSWTP